MKIHQKGWNKKERKKKEKEKKNNAWCLQNDIALTMLCGTPLLTHIKYVENMRHRRGAVTKQGGSCAPLKSQPSHVRAASRSSTLTHFQFRAVRTQTNRRVTVLIRKGRS